jgi:acylphosphatase
MSMFSKYNGTLFAVPVQIHGIPVGSAKIRPDGTIEIVMGSPSMIGQELKKKIESGEYSGLSIGLIDTNTVEVTECF